ncbi:3-phenylpropionate/cinnamic acid dioxygenase subunit beta [Haloglycomyces albus]|uniref:3-phenylpropionate/cinnamic acid dioxygenase subunit beta n=1 Tax=Haloglycomyces albus TaxID=526067 RepID=UPI00046D7C8C|nr:3-phenylpropionate/cinnamic acid dioxygenase subunit beta [Haloglycomyces albus]
MSRARAAEDYGIDWDRPVRGAEREAMVLLLHREARLLDEEDYTRWAEMLHPDIHYWMPERQTRRRDDKRGTYAYGDMAYFDDHMDEIVVRMRRYAEPSAWADNPATRHVHLVSNIEVFETSGGERAVLSAFENVRNRNERDQDIIHGRREDLWSHDGHGWKLVARRVLTVQNILLSKNLNTFF